MTHPERFTSVFHNEIAPYTSMVINGAYWDQRFPRLMTTEQLRAIQSNPDNKFRMLSIADISCDINVRARLCSPQILFCEELPAPPTSSSLLTFGFGTTELFFRVRSNSCPMQLRSRIHSSMLMLSMAGSTRILRHLEFRSCQWTFFPQSFLWRAASTLVIHFTPSSRNW